MKKRSAAGMRGCGCRRGGIRGGGDGWYCSWRESRFRGARAALFLEVAGGVFAGDSAEVSAGGDFFEGDLGFLAGLVELFGGGGPEARHRGGLDVDQLELDEGGLLYLAARLALVVLEHVLR